MLVVPPVPKVSVWLPVLAWLVFSTTSKLPLLKVTALPLPPSVSV